MTETQTEVIWKGAASLRQFLVPVDQLSAFPDNPMREREQVMLIAKSLRHFGQVRAILTWENAEEFDLPASTIVGGHHVWRAATEFDLGWTHVAAVPAHFETFEAAAKYLALDNELSQRDAKERGLQLAFTDISEFVGEEAYEQNKAMVEHAVELVDIGELKSYQQLSRQDPEDLIEHIAESLKAVGWTDEQVIVARDGTILVGESVMKAAGTLGLDKIPVRRIDIDPDSPEAKQVIAKHYAQGKRAVVDDRALAELLKNLREEVDTLAGSGFDENMLGALLLSTRSVAEIKDANEAMEWVGLPEYERIPLPVKLIISFENDEARDLFMLERIPEALQRKKSLGTNSIWWPPRGRDDPHSLRFVAPHEDGKAARDQAANLHREYEPSDGVETALSEPGEGLIANTQVPEANAHDPAHDEREEDSDRVSGSPPEDEENPGSSAIPLLQAPDLDEFLARCESAGVDAALVRETAPALISHYKQSQPAREMGNLEQRWYDSLEKDDPDWSVYGDDLYVADLWACWVVYSRRYLRSLLSPTALPDDGSIAGDLPPLDRIADLGCGIGYTTAALKQMWPHAEVIGTNLSGIRQTEIARQVGVEYEFAVVQDLVDVGAVDLVFASEYFEHFRRPVEHLRDVIRIMQPAALIVANTFGAKSVGHFDQYEVDGELKDGRGTSSLFARTLRDAGYEKVATKLWNNRPGYWRLREGVTS